MFGFRKRKIRDVYSPVYGQIVTLESVDDEVFSQKMVGDGVAVMPISNQFTAPIDGVVSKIFSTNHAYSIKSAKKFVFILKGLYRIDFYFSNVLKS